MVYNVYLLKSIKHPKKSYVGFTGKDIKFRLDEHNAGFQSIQRHFYRGNWYTTRTLHADSVQKSGKYF